MIQFTPQREWIEGQGVLIWLTFITGIYGGLAMSYVHGIPLR